jgi:hypothetical protein
MNKTGLFSLFTGISYPINVIADGDVIAARAHKAID